MGFVSIITFVIPSAADETFYDRLVTLKTTKKKTKTL